jgi:MFS family permease
MRIHANAAWFALGASAGWNVANVGAVATRIGDSYGVSLAVVGFFTTALFITHAILQVPAGRLCDRYGPRAVGAAGLLVTAGASLLIASWHDARAAIILRAVAGVGTAFSFVAGSDYARATSGTAVVQGLYGATAMLAGGIALVLIPLLDGWRAPFVSAAVLAGAGAVIVMTAPGTHVPLPRARGFPSLRDGGLARYSAMHAASFGLSVVVANWIVTLIERNAGASAATAGAIGALTLVLGVITRPLGGHFENRPAVLRASFLLGGLGVALLGVTSSLPVAVLAAALVGLAAGIPFAPAFARAARERPEAPAAAVGLVNMSAAVTILVATPLVGLTFSLPGSGRIGFLVIAAVWAAAALCVPTSSRRALRESRPPASHS